MSIKNYNFAGAQLVLYISNEKYDVMSTTKFF